MNSITTTRTATSRFGKASCGRQRGFGMIQMLLVLVVGAVITAVAYDQYNTSSRKARMDAAKAEIVDMVSGAQSLYGTANQYGNVTTAIAVTSSVVPPRLRIAGTSTAQNRYNGAITFTPATLTTANDSLALGYGSVRREDCQDLVVGLDTMTRRITVGGTEVKAADAVVDIAALSSACDANPTSDFVLTIGRGQ